MTRTVLITGCSSGFGKLTAWTFHDKGWNVVATMRAPERVPELADDDRMLVLKLDVTDPDSISAAFAAARARFGRIDAVVNNAGYGGDGLFEQASDTDIRAMFETNVFGPMNVMREALPEMRAAANGAIVNVTSMAGHLGPAGARGLFRLEARPDRPDREHGAGIQALWGCASIRSRRAPIRPPRSASIPTIGWRWATPSSSRSPSACGRR